MAKFYLSRPDGSYSDHADYPTQPEVRDDGTWQAGDPPEGSQPPQALVERLSEIFEMGAAGIADVALRAHFRQLQVAVNFVLTNGSPDPEVAMLYIATATMPGDTYTPGYELPEPYKTLQIALLAEFEGEA